MLKNVKLTFSFRYIHATILLLLFYSCKKESTTSPTNISSGTRIKKITTSVISGIVPSSIDPGDSVLFFYSTNNKITKIIYYNNSVDLSRTLNFFRNTNGSLYKVTEQELRYPPASNSSDTNYIFTNSQGQYTNSTFSDWPYLQSRTYTYQGDKIIEVKNYTNQNLTSTNSVTYDGRGNVVSYKGYQYTYNATPNPISMGNDVFVYDLNDDGDITLAGPNMCTSIKNDLGITISTSSFELNSSGYPSIVTINEYQESTGNYLFTTKATIFYE